MIFIPKQKSNYFILNAIVDLANFIAIHSQINLVIKVLFLRTVNDFMQPIAADLSFQWDVVLKLRRYPAISSA